MKSGDVYKLIEEECHDYETYNGKLNPIYVVEDQSWDKEHFHVDFCRHRCSCGQFQENGYPCVHALYILYKCKNDGQAESYIERGYLRKEIAKTCYVPPDGWNEMLKGYGKKKKVELLDESFQPEYANIDYVPWELAGKLAKRHHSRGEKEKNEFTGKGKGKGNKRRSKSSHIRKFDSTNKLNGWK